MPEIAPILQRRIGTAAYELLAVARDLRPNAPEIADIYTALGRGIYPLLKSESNESGVSILVPDRCSVVLKGKEHYRINGPLTLELNAWSHNR